MCYFFYVNENTQNTAFNRKLSNFGSSINASFHTARDKKRKSRRRNGKKESEDSEKKDEKSEGTNESTGISFSLGNIFGSNKNSEAVELEASTASNPPPSPAHVLMVKTENITHEPFESNDEIKVGESFDYTFYYHIQILIYEK